MQDLWHELKLQDMNEYKILVSKSEGQRRLKCLEVGEG